MKHISTIIKISMSLTLVLFALSLATPATASAITREDVLNSIVSFQENSTENEINVSIEELITEEEQANSTRLTVNILDYGANPNDDVSDKTALQNACDYLKSQGGGNVVFPATDDPNSRYIFNSQVYIHPNIRLIGAGTNITRTFNNIIPFFRFLGNNTMAGFNFDGGLGTVPYKSGNLYSVTEEYVHYVDFSVYNEGCIFYNNTFKNSLGSFIGKGGNTIIYNNTFGDYGDHSVYFGTPYFSDSVINGETYYAKKVIVANNTFSSTLATRDAIKFRNTGEKAIIANNTFDLENGYLFTFQLYDPTIQQGNIKDLSFSYNTVEKCKDFGRILSSIEPVGLPTGKIDNLKISHNIIKDCAGIFRIGGKVDYAATQTTDNFNEANIDFDYNKFEKRFPQIHLINKGEGLSVNIRNNEAFGTVNGNGPMYISGNTSLNLIENEFRFNGCYQLVMSPYENNNNTASKAGIQATRPQTITIRNNIFTDIRTVFYEHVDRGTTYLNENIDLNIFDNSFSTDGAAALWNGKNDIAILTINSLKNQIKARLYVFDNDVTIRNTPSSITHTYYPAGYYIDDSFFPNKESKELIRHLILTNEDLRANNIKLRSIN